MIKIKKYFYSVVVLLGIILALISGKTTLAATAGVSEILKSDKTYTNFDLDGDGKKDKIVLKTKIERGYVFSAYFWINGKKVYTLANKNTTYEYATYLVITLQNGKKYIYVGMEGANSGISLDQIFEYRKGAITKVANISNMMKDYQGASYVQLFPIKNIRVSGNKITVDFTAMNFSIGTGLFTIEYKYKNGKLMRNGYSGVINNNSKCYHARKNIKIYEKPGSAKSKFILKTGEGAYVEKYYSKKGKLYLRVRDLKGNIGWIKALTRSQIKGLGRSPLFEEGRYVG